MDSMNGKRNEEYSHIQDKGEIGFIDYEDNASVCTYKPEEEGPILISVPFPLQNGKPRSVLVGETSSDPITITNTTSEPVELWKVEIYDSNPKESFTVSLMEPPSANTDLEDDSGFVEFFCLEDRVLQPGQTLTIWLLASLKELVCTKRLCTLTWRMNGLNGLFSFLWKIRSPNPWHQTSPIRERGERSRWL